MWVPGLGLSLCVTALQLTSDGKTFWRVEEEMSWYEALDYCRRHHTDLADLQSTSGWSSLAALYALISSTAAWVGLFFDGHVGGLRWSSGSTFSDPEWGSLPIFEDGLCATLYSITDVPSLGAASCTAPKPFICYYGAITAAYVLQMRQAVEAGVWVCLAPLEIRATEAEVRIGGLIFKRFDQERDWLSALRFCCTHYTDLADLQTVTDEMGKEALKSITTKVEAWIGLYIDKASGSLRWSSDLGPNSIPAWLQVPQFGAGLCAGLRSYWSFSPRVSAVICSSLKPFICFDDPAIGHRESAELPQLFYTPFAEAAAGTASRPTVTSESSDTDGRETATATQAQHWSSSDHPDSKEKTPAPQPGQLFGILKADFIIPILMDPEDMKDQFLSEIQEALKLTLGHEQFRLKWVGFEVNKK
ncbi:putative C-type lectin domain family 20 member A [Camelus dromedarius]|uniref:Putative C-type lectin domain family 20 member A n=1 Tax=Camelus dromedarius TaxID=9838 RepID=A0A5N4CNU0_CAMDR|nr:putative C-type lectin domain family 20 member A [Camelus dromedarius]